MTACTLTQSRLKEMLEYNNETGIFTWRFAVSRFVKSGQVSGHVHHDGYRQIMINNKQYMAHRLAWLYVHGEWPADQIDHIDGNKLNNTISNLRECTPGENQQNRVSKRNSASKYLGVSWHKKSRKWQAMIRLNGHNKYLGCFPIEEEAYAAYCKAKSSLHLFNPLARAAI